MSRVDTEIIHNNYLSSAGQLDCLLGKRCMDVLSAALALVVLAVPMAAIALVVRVTSPGPIVFVQERIGRDQKPFQMLKFRSMARRSGVLEPTLVGRLLRRYSIDELPQLINVLRGQMSLVGPRPLIATELAQYNPRQRLVRQSVAPGLTGLAQLRGRKDLPHDERIVWDLAYVRGWTMRLDLRLLLATLPVVLRGRGAY